MNISEVRVCSMQSIHSASSLEIEVEEPSLEQELKDVTAELERTRTKLEKMRRYAAKLKSQYKTYKQMETEPSFFQPKKRDHRKQNERLSDENAKMTSEVHFLRSQLALFMAEREELKGKSETSSLSPSGAEKSELEVDDAQSNEMVQHLKSSLHEKSLRCLQLDLNSQQLKGERDEWKHMAARLKESLSKVEQGKKMSEDTLQHYKDYIARVSDEQPDIEPPVEHPPVHHEFQVTFDSDVLSEFMNPRRNRHGPPSRDRCSISRELSECSFPTATEGGSSKYSWRTPRLMSEVDGWSSICEGSSEVGPGSTMTPPLHLVSVGKDVMKSKSKRSRSKRNRKLANSSHRSPRQQERIPEEEIPREIQVFVGTEQSASFDPDWNSPDLATVTEQLSLTNECAELQQQSSHFHAERRASSKTHDRMSIQPTGISWQTSMG